MVFKTFSVKVFLTLIRTSLARLEAKSKMDGPNCEIDRLPEACLSHVLSFTSPRDSCRAAVVSPTFHQAADSNIVWSRFLPPDYLKILSRTVDSMSFSSCKELYFKLCDSVLIDGGKKVFSLEKETGAKCFMLGNKELHIPWVDEQWNWFSHPESRFKEVALLYNLFFLEVECSINSSELSPNTTYKSYLIFKPYLGAASGLSFPPQEVSVRLGNQICEGKVCLNPGGGRRELSPEVRVPRVRLDGWMEVELGEFNSADGSEGAVSMSCKHVNNPVWKVSLIVEGVQVRPK